MKVFAVIAFAILFPGAAKAEPFLVENGEPRAGIVIAEDAGRSTRLAADELRTSLEKISGAKLPVTTNPIAGVLVKIYVGRSPHTDRLGVTAEGLEHGAYRIVSGRDWLVLIGDDTDFVPAEPWARNNGGIVSGRLQADWEAASGLPYGVPNRGIYKNRARMPEHLAIGEREYFWTFDERGSFNAVCGFLRSLGMRWYQPGPLGEVVPKMKSIPLPVIDETARPDFSYRAFNVRFGNAGEATTKWFMRLGYRYPYGVMIAHGMHGMTHLDRILDGHPEWFALYGGKRDTQKGKRLNHLCYSNPELFEETVKWARAQFDVYDYEAVSIMPPDAYIAICQCDLCEGKDVPEMGARGKLSNHVWDFVNRVAIETGKTHPDRKILCCAYGANTDPPTNIDKLERNVQVVIVGGRRPRNNFPEQRVPIRALRAGWEAKTNNAFMIFENYPFTDRGWYLPAFISRTMGESINATKGRSLGEDIWLSLGRDFDTKAVAFNAFQVYFTARMYWGGREQDAAAMLDEHCELFYGPAAAEMKTFFDYCESNWQAMETEKDKVDAALAHFAAAQESADPESVYGKRLVLVDEFLERLRSKSALLGQKRGPVPKLRTVRDPVEPIVIDGILDDRYWRDCPTSSTGRLRELQTGELPVFGTTIKAGWDRAGNNLYFAIRCEEKAGQVFNLPRQDANPPRAPLNIATTEDEDQSIWYGDAVEILLATDSHSYYQLAVNPAGALVDLDRGAERNAWFRWESQAEVAAHIADDHWTVEIRIPVTDDENDPLNQVVGRKPGVSLPWFFNICRQRIREGGAEHSAFSATGTKSFHEPMKFAHFYDGRSHAFEADPSFTDYLVEKRKAADLDACLALTEIEGLTDLQRSDALSLAARAARSKKDLGRADEIATGIPLEHAAEIARMENLLARREFEALLAEFGAADLASWPFTRIGAAAWARGRARHALKQGKEAEADLRLALAYTSDSRTRMSILRAIGQNRESVLEDDAGALEVYRAIAESKTNTGGAEFFYGIQGAARILTGRGRFDEALAILDLVDVGKLRGTWHHSMRLARAEALSAAGRVNEARAIWKDIVDDEKAASQHRAMAEKALEQE